MSHGSNASALVTHRMIFPWSLVALGLDAVSKSWAAGLRQPVELGPVDLAHVSNDALVLSLGGALPLEAVALGRLVIFAICAFVAVRGARFRIRERLGFALIAVGGLGNLIDLVARGGAVVDFIGINPVALLSGREGFHLFFNLADLFIVVGLVFTLPVIRAFGLAVQRRFQVWEAMALRRG